MAQQRVLHTTVHIEAILRLRQVVELTGRSKSSLYIDVRRGVFTGPISIGKGRGSVGWPASEVAALNRARIAGLSEEQLRDLVAELHERRSDMAPRARPSAAT